MAAFDVVDQILEWNSGTPKTRCSVHDLRIYDDGGLQHARPIVPCKIGATSAPSIAPIPLGCARINKTHDPGALRKCQFTNISVTTVEPNSRSWSDATNPRPLAPVAASRT